MVLLRPYHTITSCLHPVSVHLFEAYTRCQFTINSPPQFTSSRPLSSTTKLRRPEHSRRRQYHTTTTTHTHDSYRRLIPAQFTPASSPTPPIYPLLLPKTMRSAIHKPYNNAAFNTHRRTHSRSQQSLQTLQTLQNQPIHHHQRLRNMGCFADLYGRVKRYIFPAPAPAPPSPVKLQIVSFFCFSLLSFSGEGSGNWGYWRYQGSLLIAGG